jgi:hypothetical protein
MAVGIVVVAAAVAAGRHLAFVVCVVVFLVSLLCCIVGAIFATFTLILAVFACTAVGVGMMVVELAGKVLDAVGVGNDIRIYRLQWNKDKK